MFDNWTVTLVIRRMVAKFLGAPFPSESAFVCETLPQNCPTELQIRVFYMFAGHEAVIHLEMCAVSE